MVVVQDGGYLITHGIPRLSDPNIQGEDSRHYRKDENMDLGLDEAAHAQSRLALLGSLDGGLVDGREGILGRLAGGIGGIGRIVIL